MKLREFINALSAISVEGNEDAEVQCADSDWIADQGGVEENDLKIVVRSNTKVLLIHSNL